MIEWRDEVAELQECWEIVSGGSIQGYWNPKAPIEKKKGLGLDLGYSEGDCCYYLRV